MELNFLIFPAPKSSYSSRDLLDELLYIPIPPSSSSSPPSSSQHPPSSSFHPPSSFHAPLPLPLATNFHSSSFPPLPSSTSSSFSSLPPPPPPPPPSLLLHPPPSSPSIVPCLLLKPSTPSTHILIYFHGNGEDVNLSYDLLSNLRNNLQIFILAMEYPGYGVCPGKPTADKIIENAVVVYDFLIGIGFSPKKIILCGRSIGTGVATELAIRRKVAALALISGFTSIRETAKGLGGSIFGFLGYLVKERFNNLENVKKIENPILLVHGERDKFISFEHSLKLHDACKGPCELRIPQKMSHSELDYYEDLTAPLFEFLNRCRINLKERNNQNEDVDTVFPFYYFRVPEKIN